MNAATSQLEFIHRLEAVGLTREIAETIATGVDNGRHEFATRADLEPLATKAELQIVKSELKLEISEASRRQIMLFGTMLAGGLTLTIAALSIIFAVIR